MPWNEKETKLCKRLHELGVRREIWEGDWIFDEENIPYLVPNKERYDGTDWVDYSNAHRKDYFFFWPLEHCLEWLTEKGWDWSRLEGQTGMMKFITSKGCRRKVGWGQTRLAAVLKVCVQVAEEKEAEHEQV